MAQTMVLVLWMYPKYMRRRMQFYLEDIILQSLIWPASGQRQNCGQPDVSLLYRSIRPAGDVAETVR